MTVRPPNSTLTDQKENLIMDLRRQGYMVKRISIIVGCHPRSVEHVIARRIKRQIETFGPGWRRDYESLNEALPPFHPICVEALEHARTMRID